MKASKIKIALPLTFLILLALAACNLTEQEVDSIASTVESLSPSELAGLAATVEALPPAQAAVLEEIVTDLATIAPNEVAAAKSTVDAARATATAVGVAVSSGERVNATEVPNIAPVIVYFFASAPTQAQVAGGIRYNLNWTTEKANRVEIFGHVMGNPVQGSWPVYNDSNDWVLWAANDQAWVEQPLQVRPDQDTGNSLQNVSVNSRNITLTFRDPQFVDGDQINVDVNGARVIDAYVTGGRDVSFPVTLQSGSSTVAINAQYAGVTPPLVVEVTTGNTTSGPATQQTRGLNAGETQSFTITAP